MVKGPLTIRVLVAGWLFATAAGLATLAAYANRPGQLGQPPALWPVDTGITRTRDGATLVVALHPACACSKATLEQLDRLAGFKPGAVRIVALVAQYAALPADADVLSATLAPMRNITRIADPNAALAQRFGALTSGHALLYDPAGRLRFSGGLTRARGHAGDSPGLDVLRSYVEGQPLPTLATTSVFGCALTQTPAVTR